LYQPPF